MHPSQIGVVCAGGVAPPKEPHVQFKADNCPTPGAHHAPHALHAPHARPIVPKVTDSDPVVSVPLYTDFAPALPCVALRWSLRPSAPLPCALLAAPGSSIKGSEGSTSSEGSSPTTQNGASVARTQEGSVKSLEAEGGVHVPRLIQAKGAVKRGKGRKSVKAAAQAVLARVAARVGLNYHCRFLSQLFLAWSGKGGATWPIPVFTIPSM